MKPFIGIDIGGTKCAVTLSEIDKGIRIIKKLRFESEAARGCEHMLQRLYAAVDTLVADEKASAGVEAIGISCGGPLDERSGTVLCPPNLPGWIDIPLTRLFEERYHVKAFLMNDANACALAEWKLGAGRGTKNMIFLTMGTGMGGGVVSEGKLVSGANSMAGEIGHLRLSEDGPEGFGKKGSFEGWTSGGGIARQAVQRTRELIADGRAPAWIRDGHAESEISAKLIAEYAKAGDADALAIYETVGKYLGKGLSLLVDAFNPEAIVIGSIFTRSRELLENSMRRELEKEAIPHSLEAVRILPAESGENLGDYAAIMAALYSLGISPMYEAGEKDERVLCHYERLFKRYPELECVRRSLMDAYVMIRDSFSEGGKLLLCGNGGSCADCDHIAGELMKGFYLKRPLGEDGVLSHLQGALPAIALTEHSALSTAFMNDCESAYVYAQQLVGYGRRGDVLIAISTSGNAVNVINACEAAKRLGVKTVALSGGSGGRLKAACDCAIIAPASTPADVQEYHLPIYHTLCAMLEAHYYKE